MNLSTLKQEIRLPRTGSNSTLKQKRTTQQNRAYESYKSQRPAEAKPRPPQTTSSRRAKIRPLQSPKLQKMNINPLSVSKTKKVRTQRVRSKKPSPQRVQVHPSEEIKENRDMNNTLTENFTKKNFREKCLNGIKHMRRKVKNSRKRRRKNSSRLKEYLSSYTGIYRRKSRVERKSKRKENRRPSERKKKRIKIVRNPRAKTPQKVVGLAQIGAAKVVKGIQGQERAKKILTSKMAGEVVHRVRKVRKTVGEVGEEVRRVGSASNLKKVYSGATYFDIRSNTGNGQKSSNNSSRGSLHLEKASKTSKVNPNSFAGQEREAVSASDDSFRKSPPGLPGKLLARELSPLPDHNLFKTAYSGTSSYQLKSSFGSSLRKRSHHSHSKQFKRRQLAGSCRKSNSGVLTIHPMEGSKRHSFGSNCVPRRSNSVAYKKLLKQKSDQKFENLKERMRFGERISFGPIADHPDRANLNLNATMGGGGFVGFGRVGRKMESLVQLGQRSHSENSLNRMISNSLKGDASTDHLIKNPSFSSYFWQQSSLERSSEDKVKLGKPSESQQTLNSSIRSSSKTSKTRLKSCLKSRDSSTSSSKKKTVTFKDDFKESYKEEQPPLKVKLESKINKWSRVVQGRAVSRGVLVEQDLGKLGNRGAWRAPEVEDKSLSGSGAGVEESGEKSAVSHSLASSEIDSKFVQNIVGISKILEGWGSMKLGGGGKVAQRRLVGGMGIRRKLGV